MIPDAVAEELSRRPGRPGGGVPYLGSVTRLTPGIEYLCRVEEGPPSIGAGEREVIALALERDAIAVIDDQRGRLRANRAGVALTGTLGVLQAIHLAGAAERSLSEDLEALDQAGMYLTVNLKQRVLESFRTE